ncbi:unnamed protein product, partial [Darwinula stevensoni]
LPEMPLPVPLPESHGHKSLLFHPLLVEESRRLLNTRDETLIPQLIQGISLTSADHIELKDPYAGGEPSPENLPELLHGILQRHPGVFRGQGGGYGQVQAPAAVQKWGNYGNAASTGNSPSPASMGAAFSVSPYPSSSSPASTPRMTPQQDSAASPQSPYPQLPVNKFTPAVSKTPAEASRSPLHRPTVIQSEQSHRLHQSSFPNQSLVQSSETCLSASDVNSRTALGQPLDIVNSGSECVSDARVSGNFALPQPQQQAVNASNGTSRLGGYDSGFHQINGPLSQSAAVNQVQPIPCEAQAPGSAKLRGDEKLSQSPVVKQEQVDVIKMGRGAKDKGSNHRISRKPTVSYQESSSSEDEGDGKQKNRYFKAREKERDEKKRKEREERKKRKRDGDDDYVPVEFGDYGSSLSERVKQRKRGPMQGSDIGEDTNSCDVEGGVKKENEEAEPLPKKPKVRKVERKLVPVIEKLGVDDLVLESNAYQRFSRLLDHICESAEDVEITADLDEEAEVPSEVLIAKYKLQELREEAGKLKLRSAMELVPAQRLVQLLSILEKNIRDGAKVLPVADPEDDEDAGKLWVEMAMERVSRAVDASLTALYRAHAREVREKSIMKLYHNLSEMVGLLAELLDIQRLTDTTVLQVSTLGVAPFFVENVPELQLNALKLVTVVFSRYDKHRRLLLDDILASIARLPSSKRSLRTFHLQNSEEKIQMLTALVLQLIQCVVTLPQTLVGPHDPKAKENQKEQEKDEHNNGESQVDLDVLMNQRYETAKMTAANFLSVFLTKCGSKNEEIDYRPLFENFVQDLLSTVNRPEWPAAELLLSLLGHLLAQNFSNKNIEMPLRVSSLDYLGVVAARLRKDAVTSRLKLETMDNLIKEVKQKEEEEGINDEELNKSLGEVKDEEEERMLYLVRLLLEYLSINSDNDSQLLHARHFYIVQWYRDAVSEITRMKLGENTPSSNHSSPVKGSAHKRKKKKRKGESSEEESSQGEDSGGENSRHSKSGIPNSQTIPEEVKNEIYRLSELRKKFLLTRIQPYGAAVGNTFQTELDPDSAHLISRYLASKRSFSQSFSMYLRQILRVLVEPAIAVRTKAMKCMAMIVEADPTVLALKDMEAGVRHSFLDASTSVREASVDLVGRFILSRPSLIDQYYDMLSARILDTGVSVRKRVIKILKDICIECPTYRRIPEICVKMIRRVNDEEGIRKLVMEVFQNMWFSPVRERPVLDKEALIHKVLNITDVVATCKEVGLDWIEQLLLSLFKPKEDKEDSTKVVTEPPKALVTACHQIVDCLVENILQIEENSLEQSAAEAGSSVVKQGTNSRLVACMNTLFLFAKIRPQLLVPHASTLQPYLSLRCQTRQDYEIISAVARTLELIVPLIEHPSETFLAQLEEDSVKLILTQDKVVVNASAACLGSVVNNVTHNYALVKDCFLRYYDFLTQYKSSQEQNPGDNRLSRNMFFRSLYTVGLLMRHFDYRDPNVRCGLPDGIMEEVVNTLMYFMHLTDGDIQRFALQALGSMCIRHYDIMLLQECKDIYTTVLTHEDEPIPLKVQVLNNLETFLHEEEVRMMKMDQEWSRLGKNESLKDMGDVSSGMASTVIQVYLKQILESFLNRNISVRRTALKVIQLILTQGLVHPVQIVPYLIVMGTDPEEAVAHTADKQLQDMEKKYPGFLHMKAMSGIRLSYDLQTIIQPESPIRGYRQSSQGESQVALNGFVYSLLRTTKQQRRAVALSILKQFDDQGRLPLAEMLYMSDNLAYFPYQVLDEPLFIIHHIDVMISVNGSNLLQTFKEGLLPPEGAILRFNPKTGKEELFYDEDEDDDFDSILRRLPEDLNVLQDAITASQGCLLLLMLKQHLKDMYGITDNKISQYLPTESSKVHEKTVSRRNIAKFMPKATIARLKGLKLPRVKGSRSRHEVTQHESKEAAAKIDLINQYLDFKQLMLKIDPTEEDEDDRTGAGVSNGPLTAIAARDSSSLTITIKQEPNLTPNNSSTSYPPPPSLSPPPEQSMTGPNPPITVVIDRERLKEGVDEVSSQKVPKLRIVPPKPPTLKHHSHKHHHHHVKHNKSEKHKKKKKKKKYRLSSSEEEDSEGGSDDPDFTA